MGLFSGGNSKRETTNVDARQTQSLGLGEVDGPGGAAGRDQVIRITETDQGAVRAGAQLAAQSLRDNQRTLDRALDSVDGTTRGALSAVDRAGVRAHELSGGALSLTGTALDRVAAGARDALSFGAAQSAGARTLAADALDRSADQSDLALVRALEFGRDVQTSATGAGRTAVQAVRDSARDSLALAQTLANPDAPSRAGPSMPLVAAVAAVAAVALIKA